MATHETLGSASAASSKKYNESIVGENIACVAMALVFTPTSHFFLFFCFVELANPPAAKKPISIPGPKTVLKSVHPSFLHLEKFRKEFPDVKMTIVCQGCWNVKGKFIEIIPGKAFQCSHKITQPVRVAFDSRKGVWEVIRKCLLLKSGSQFQMCQDNLKNRPCKVRPKCTSAHSEMEKFVWELERTSKYIFYFIRVLLQVHLSGFTSPDDSIVRE